jgi:hypothetical protein
VRAEALLDVLDEAVRLWGRDEFKPTRDRLLSQEMLRQTITELVDVATGKRSVRQLFAEQRAPQEEWPRMWGAFKRRSQRSVRALLLVLPAVATARGWIDPSFADMQLRRLSDLTAVVDGPATSPQMREIVHSLVVVARSYQRALVRMTAQES